MDQGNRFLIPVPDPTLLPPKVASDGWTLLLVSLYRLSCGSLKYDSDTN